MYAFSTGWFSSSFRFKLQAATGSPSQRGKSSLVLQWAEKGVRKAFFHAWLHQTAIHIDPCQSHGPGNSLNWKFGICWYHRLEGITHCSLNWTGPIKISTSLVWWRRHEGFFHRDTGFSVGKLLSHRHGSAEPRFPRGKSPLYSGLCIACFFCLLTVVWARSFSKWWTPIGTETNQFVGLLIENRSNPSWF